MKKLFSLLLALLLAGSVSRAEGDWLYMINVGKGDAILIKAEDNFYLIDTGKSGAWEKVEAALGDNGVTELAGVFLTHTDKDHAGGLKKLVKSGIPVKTWYAPMYSVDEGTDHPLVKATKKEPASIVWLRAGDTVDGLFTVLGPLSWDKNNEDNNSLVMMFDNGRARVLLSGDMETGEEAELIAKNTDFTCDIFKVPNHADNDVCHIMNLESLGAKLALISTDPYDKPGTPDPWLTEKLEQAGMEVYCTDGTEKGIRGTLDTEIKVTVD